MSADNYYVVRKHPEGGYTYVMGFASDSIHEHAIPVKRGRFGWDQSWPTVEEALHAAIGDYSEYGVSVHPECGGVWAS